MGLSEREVSDFSLDALVLDLEAVVERVGLESLALFAGHFAGLVAVAYAARHPERVSRLVLWCSFPRGSDFLESPQIQGLVGLIDKDWELYTEAVAHARLGWAEGEQASRFAAFIRDSTTPEALGACLEAVGKFDVTGLLPQVNTPTLVLHRSQVPLPDVGLARSLASRIPDAQLTVLEGASVLPTVGDSESVLQAIDEFLSEGEEEVSKSTPSAPSGMVTILFTDMEGSTALTQRVGDEAAQKVRRAHNEIVRTALTSNGGSEIKHTGDGIMASFTTASAALACAVAIQRGVAAHIAEQPDSPLGVYIGLNAGEPIAEDDDLFGTSVDLAARICDRAKAGEILASDVVRQLAAGKGFLFSDRGETELRGFEDPVKLYDVRWRAEGSPSEGSP